MKTLYIVIMTAVIFAAGVFAQPATANGAGADSSAARQQTVRVQSSSGASLNKQASVRPQTTKRTNWSKIKTLFE